MRASVNTNVVGVGGRTFACVGAGGSPIELGYELETLARADFSAPGRPGIQGPFSAHPKVGPATGKLHVAVYHWGWGEQVQYQVIVADGVRSSTSPRSRFRAAR